MIRRAVGNALGVIVLGWLLLGCAASRREQIIETTYGAANIAAEQLTNFSKAHEAAIVAKAETKEAAEAGLAAWRLRVDKSVKALDAVYRAVAIAGLVDNDHNFAALVQAAKVLSDELHDLGVL